MKVNYIKNKNTDTSIKDNFITMDLETRTIDNIMSVIAASVYDGYITKSFYITDYINTDELLKEAILYTLHRKYNGYRVYIHNFSRFDAAFLLRIMAKMKECQIKRILKRDSKIIDIKLNYNLKGNRSYSIHFRDSLLILPSSLKSLGVNFSVKIKKTIYPYTFVNNINIPLNYEGSIPSITFFNDINPEEFDKYCEGFKNNF
jgi:hypothetical protein